MLYFKLPYQEKIFTVVENSNNSAVSFFDFEGLEKVNFNGEIVEICVENLMKENISVEDLSLFNDENDIINKENYLKTIENIIKFINEFQLEKLVFSRRKAINFKEINLINSFRNLNKNYPNALSYLFLKDNICWIGAFSEVLGKYHKQSETFETMSVAGTLPLEKTWTNKEISEQITVTNYIENILKKYNTEVAISETKDHISGNIKHLKTEFSIKVKSDKVENLIKELHPTPAVCGIPKDICREAISTFENSERELYAGYIKVETEDILYYFVNLRCAKIYKNTALLYLGGGINKESSPENEWQETELKAEAIAKNLDHN